MAHPSVPFPPSIANKAASPAIREGKFERKPLPDTPRVWYRQAQRPAAIPRIPRTPTITPATRRASFAIGNEQAAKRVVDLLDESFPEGQAAITAFEGASGRWDIIVHFAEPPDESAIRDLVGLAAGDEVARHVSFDTVEAKDWVKATLADLVPVRAGRFVVHGQHDRANVPANKLGIEIEAALAFGTGHHGTTRGCLLLLDEVLKAHLPRRVLDLGTGTGVLAIAAAKALRIKVLASDIDPLAVRVARENARLNGAGDLVQAIHATGFSAAGIFASARRSTWCWRIFSPIRCGKWQRRWRSIWRHRRW